MNQSMLTFAHQKATVASTTSRYAVTASLSHAQDGSDSSPAMPRRACN